MRVQNRIQLCLDSFVTASHSSALSRVPVLYLPYVLPRAPQTVNEKPFPSWPLNSFITYVGTHLVRA